MPIISKVCTFPLEVFLTRHINVADDPLAPCEMALIPQRVYAITWDWRIFALLWLSPRNLMDRKHIRHDTPPTIIRLNFTALQLIDVRRFVFMTFSFKFIVSSILASEPPLHYDVDWSHRPNTFAMIANHLLLLFRNWSMIFGIVWEQ